MQITFLAHCSGTQCAPQVCSAQLSRTVLAHNVRCKFAAHNCRTLFWYTMCATSLQRTIVAHCSGTQCAPQVCSAQLSCTVLCATTHTQLPCTALFPTPPPPPPPPQPLVYHPTPIYFFSSPSPRGSVRKNVGMVGVLQKSGGGDGKKCRGGGMVWVIWKIKIWGWGWQFLGHRSQRLQWPIVITRCPASVVRRPSSVCRPSSVVR